MESTTDARNPLNGELFSSHYWNLKKSTSLLPIMEFKDQFMEVLNHSQCIFIEGMTGIGKSTQIPQWAFECTRKMDKGRVVCSQPRRLAAIYLATRVAEEMDVKIGEEVGYGIRDEDNGGSLLKYCTDGRILWELKTNPLLEDCSVIIVDEIDERTINIDILIGFLKGIMKKRSDIKIILMGSSIDYPKWEKYIGKSTLISIPSPVSPTIVYAPLPDLTPFEAAIKTVIDVHSTEQDEGDILLFLPTQDEIEKACQEIERRLEESKTGGLKCIRLYSTLPFDQVKTIFDPSPKGSRKCIVSSRIGETTFVFEGISFVIDSGLSQVFDPLAENVEIIPTSKNSAIRRMERAGVKAIRLYSEEKYEEMEKEETPEIFRIDRDRVERRLNELGIEDVEGFDFIDKLAIPKE